MGYLKAGERVKLSYKAYPKADARRYFVALLAVAKLRDRATIHYVAQEIGCTRAEAQRALEAAETQFGVQLKRIGPRYEIESWGVLKHRELLRFAVPVDVGSGAAEK